MMHLPKGARLFCRTINSACRPAVFQTSFFENFQTFPPISPPPTYRALSRHQQGNTVNTLGKPLMLAHLQGCRDSLSSVPFHFLCHSEWL